MRDKFGASKSKQVEITGDLKDLKLCSHLFAVILVDFNPAFDSCSTFSVAYLGALTSLVENFEGAAAVTKLFRW